MFLRLPSVLLGLLLFSAVAGASEPLPPAAGPTEPRVQARLGDDGLYHQSWFVSSFLDLKEDFNEAKAAGKRFAVVFGQRGCIYCTKMHTEVLSLRYINDYLRENYAIVQIDLWGSREVTDFDGTKMSEKKLAERWGIAFTPTIVFFKDDLAGLEGKWGRPLEAVERLPLAFGPPTFYDLFVFVKAKIYQSEPSFQRFHIARMAEREKTKGQ
jgi:thioredoxin-related protein